jgi:hypothetical protein
MFATAAIALWLTQFLLSLFVRSSYEEPVFTMFLVFLINLAGAVIVAYELVYLRWTIARKFITQSYNPNFQPNLPLYSEFLQPLTSFFKGHIIQPEPNQNVITFGRYQPFLGAGGQISQWTLAIDQKPPEDQIEGPTRIDIPVEELYQASDQEIATLNLLNLEQLSRLFVDGFELEVDGEILTSLKSPQSLSCQKRKFGRLDSIVSVISIVPIGYIDIPISNEIRCFPIFYVFTM